MKNPFRRRPRLVRTHSAGGDYPLGVVSPMDTDSIRPGDPGWEVWEHIQRTGKAAFVVYDSTNGEIVSIRDVEEEP